MDEEDIAEEQKSYGPSATVRKLIIENKQDNVNDLNLESYATNILKHNNLKKRATLELIRNELLEPHEEVRLEFAGLKSDELFTMLTGETTDSLQEGMVIPVRIRRFFPDHIEVKLDCGLDGHISESEYPEGVGGDRGVEPRQFFSINQTVQAKLLYLQRKIFTCQLSVRERAVREAFKRTTEHTQSEWDYAQEASDKREAQKEKEDVSGRAQRVIKHPLFRPFNSSQAEEFLGSQPRGSVVIRPSSKGLDHLVVTWKVADGIYQHIDVLELNKDNEFALGKTLRIGNATYSDLDELIASHVQVMAKKVDEMMHDERFQNLSRAQAGKFLKRYPQPCPKY
jgi:transcription elongation factor SPT6